VFKQNRIHLLGIDVKPACHYTVASESLSW
jgi:hypothetical protein